MGIAVAVAVAIGVVISVQAFAEMGASANAQASGRMSMGQGALLETTILIGVAGCGYFVGMLWEYKTGYEQKRYNGREYGLGMLAATGISAAAWAVVGAIGHFLAR